MTKILCTALSQQTEGWQLEELLLPHQNINGQLRAWLAAGGRPALDTYVGLLAVDPFVPWGELVAQLRQCGVDKVCNFPPVAALPTEFVQLLDTAGNGPRSEQSRLKWFAEQGFELAWIAAKDALWQAGKAPQLTLRLDARRADLRGAERRFERDQVQGV